MRKLKLLCAVLSVSLLFVGCTAKADVIDPSAAVHGYEEAVESFTQLSVAEIEQKQAAGDSFFLYTGRVDCPYCQSFAPLLAECSKEETVEIFYLDSIASYDESPPELQRFRDDNEIEFVPSLLLFDGPGIRARLDSDDDMQKQPLADFIRGNPVVAVGSGKIYVTPAWVRSVMDGGQPQSQNYVIIEASQAGGGAPAGHIPGAVFMELDAVEDEKYRNLRPPEQIAQLMKEYGIAKDTTVITYGGAAASRVAFACFWAGVEEVHVLHGGLDAWTKAGFASIGENSTPTPTEEDFGVPIPARAQYLLSMPQDVLAAREDDDLRLVSIRSWEEFIGKTSGVSGVDRAGEPQGAVWGHDEEYYYNADGAIKDFAVIEAMLAEWDVAKGDAIAFYSGTGLQATVPFFIFYENGWENIKLYDGGWLAWQIDESLPVQMGDPRESVIYSTCCS